MPSCALCGVETLLFVQSIPICVDCDRNSEKDFLPHHIEGHCRARTPMPAGLHSLASMTFDYINDIRSAIPALVDKSAAGTEIRIELLVQIAASVLPLRGANGPDRLIQDTRMLQPPRCYAGRHNSAYIADSRFECQSIVLPLQDLPAFA